MLQDETPTVEYNVQDNSDIDNSVLKAADKQYRLENYSEALLLLEGALHKTVSTDLYLHAGNCLYKLGRIRESVEYWQKAIDLDSKNSQAYANIGNVHYKQGDKEKAISYWVAALIPRPEDARTCLNLAIAFKEKNMRFEAIKYYEKYLKYTDDTSSQEYREIKANIKRCFDFANEYIKKGIEFQNTGDPASAVKCYYNALANYPNLSKANMNLGSLFFKDNNPEVALKYWKAAYFIEPTYDRLILNLAIAYDILKKFDYAYCYYHKYMDIIYKNEAEYLRTKSRADGMERLIGRNPLAANAHLLSAREFLANNQFPEAIDEFQNYIILAPEERAKYLELINKLQAYVEPEKEIIEKSYAEGKNLMRDLRYKEAKAYFYRVMNLSSPKELIYSKARGRYTICEANEFKGH